MSELFEKYSGKFIPVVDWSFFSNSKESCKLFNEDTWEGWVSGWTAVASNALGDAIIFYSDAIYEVEHGTGKPPKPSLITNDIQNLENLFDQLLNYIISTENDSLEELVRKKDILLNLKKVAPKPLKFNFTMALDDLKESIGDIKFNNSKEGKFIQAAKEFRKTVFSELQKNGKYLEVGLFRSKKKFTFLIGGMLKSDESLDEIKEIIGKHASPYPVEYDKFKSYGEPND